MRILKDERKLEKALNDLKLETLFELDGLHPVLCQYEKGELISGPHIRQKHLLFIESGVVQFYGIGFDGRKIPVNIAKKGSVIGDVEYSSRRPSNIYSEVLKDTVCIGFPVKEDREVLDRNVRFLHFLLAQITRKVYLTNVTDQAVVSVEEKLLYYMKEEWEDHELRGVEHACLRLRCSRRQLQRVLKQLCEDGLIEKSGKGIYRLTESGKEKS